MCFDQFKLHHIGFDVELTRAVVDGKLEPALEAIVDYDAAANWPWPFIYKEINETYADCQFILTVRRDSQTWMRSLKSQAKKRPHSLYREWVYGCQDPVGHERELMRKYEQHNENVRNYFANESGKLLQVCWDTGSDWRGICEFLDQPIPTTPFPHANRSARRKENLLSRLYSRVGLPRAA